MYSGHLNQQRTVLLKLLLNALQQNGRHFEAQKVNEIFVNERKITHQDDCVIEQTVEWVRRGKPGAGRWSKVGVSLLGAVFLLYAIVVYGK